MTPQPFVFDDVDENAQLNSPAFLERQFVVRGPVADVIRTLSQYRNVGTTSWYPAAAQASGANTTSALAANFLYAYPHVIEAPYRIDGLAFEVTTAGAGSSGRVAVYTTSDNYDQSLYPGVLVAESGSISTASTGVKSNTSLQPVDLEPGLYWFCYVCSATAPTIRVLPTASVGPAIGMAATLGASPLTSLSVAFTYAAAPQTFPSGATVQNSVAPVMAYRLSALSQQEKVTSYEAFAARSSSFSIVKVDLMRASDFATTTKYRWTRIAVGIRTGTKFAALAEYDSRKNKMRGGVPFSLFSTETAIPKDSVVEVQFVQGGWPKIDLSTLSVQTSVAYARGA